MPEREFKCDKMKGKGMKLLAIVAVMVMAFAALVVIFDHEDVAADAELIEENQGVTYSFTAPDDSSLTYANKVISGSTPNNAILSDGLAWNCFEGFGYFKLNVKFTGEGGVTGAKKVLLVQTNDALRYCDPSSGDINRETGVKTKEYAIGTGSGEVNLSAGDYWEVLVPQNGGSINFEFTYMTEGGQQIDEKYELTLDLSTVVTNVNLGVVGTAAGSCNTKMAGTGWTYPAAETGLGFNGTLGNVTFVGNGIKANGATDAVMAANGFTVKTKIYGTSEPTDYLYSNHLSTYVRGLTSSAFVSAPNVKIVSITNDTDVAAIVIGTDSAAKGTTKVVDWDLNGTTYTPGGELYGVQSINKIIQTNAHETWTIHNGEIVAPEAAVAADAKNDLSYILLQSYKSVTLKNLTVDISGITTAESNHAAAITSTSGSINMDSTVTIKTKSSDYAVAATWLVANNTGTDGQYYDKPSIITINGSDITGQIIASVYSHTYDNNGGTPELSGISKVIINSGKIDGNISTGVLKKAGHAISEADAIKDRVAVEINGGRFTDLSALPYVQSTKSITLADDYSNTAEVEVLAGTTLVIDDDVALTNSGTITINGAITNNGSITNSGTMISSGSVTNTSTLSNSGKIVFASGTATNSGTITNTGEIGFVSVTADPGTTGIVTSGVNGKITWYAPSDTAYSTPIAHISSKDSTGSFKMTKGTTGLVTQFTAGAANEFAVNNNINDKIVIDNTAKVSVVTDLTNAGTIENAGVLIFKASCTNSGTITNTGEIAFVGGMVPCVPGTTGVVTSGVNGKVTWYPSTYGTGLTSFIYSGDASGSFKMSGSSASAIAIDFTAGTANEINLTVASGCTMSIASGVKVTVLAGKQLEVLGTLTNNGAIFVYGTLKDAFACPSTQSIFNDEGIINVYGTLQSGITSEGAVNIDGIVNFITRENTKPTFEVKCTPSGDPVKLIAGSNAMITLASGAVSIDAVVGGDVDYTLVEGSVATINETGFFKSGDSITIDGALTVDNMTIPSGVTMTVNGIVSVAATKSIVVTGTGTVTVSADGSIIDGGTFDFTGATQGTKVLKVEDGGLLTIILDGSNTTESSVMKLVGVVAGANGITVSKGSVVIDGTYTTDADGTITITSGTATITGTVDEGVKIVVPAGVTVNIPEGGTLEFDAGSSFENSGTIKFESKTSSTIIYEEGSTVNGVEIEVTTKQTEEGIIVAIIVTLRTENGDKLMLYYEGEYCEVVFLEAFEGDSFVDVLANVGVEPVKSRVSFDGWYNVLNEKVTSDMTVGAVAPTLTAKFTETPREGVTPYTPSIEPTVITVDEIGGYDNTSMLIVAVAMLVVAIFVLGYVVIVKRK